MLGSIRLRMASLEICCLKSLQTFFDRVELASQRRLAVSWQQKWHIQQPASGPLVVMRRLGTVEASRHYLGSGIRLEADPVLPESAEWRLLVGCWRPKPVKWKISRHRGGQEDKRLKGGQPPVAQQQPTLQPTSLPPSRWASTVCHGVAVLKPPTSGPLVLCL